MIRNSTSQDLKTVLEIWLDGNLEAHAFIPGEYWKSNLPLVWNQLQDAEVWVYEKNGILLGFAGMQGDYLAGIFVKKEARSMGIGRELLKHLKELHPALTLHVYEKNHRAVDFYRREGFVIAVEELDANTGEKEFTMRWKIGSGR